MRTILAVLASVVLAQTPAPESERIIDPDNGHAIEALVERALEQRRTLRTAGQTLAQAPSRVRRVRLGATSIDDSAPETVVVERRLAGDVRRRYVDAVAAARKLESITNSLDLARESHRLARARAEQGRIPWRTESELFVEVNRLDASHIAAEGKAAVALLELKKLVGLSPEEPLRLRGEAGMDRAPLPEPEGLQRALASRGDLPALRSAENLAVEQLEQARTPGTTNTTARAAVEAARRLRQYGELAVRHEVKAAYARLEKARQAHGVFRENILDEALENVEVARRTYELGARPLLDYLAQEQYFVDLELKYADVWKEYMDALIEVDLITGR